MNQSGEFFKARVESIGNTGIIISDYQRQNYQDIKLKILSGPEKNKEINLRNTMSSVKVGDTLVVYKDENYQITDFYRLNQVSPIIVLFFVIVVLLSRWKGVGSFLGMLISLGVITGFIVPQILAGQNPLFISIVGSIFIMITTIYLAHGFSKKTTVAVISTFITLTVTAYISAFFVNITKLSGLGSEDASSLVFGSATEHIDFKGLLLGGILIGALGVLDDVTTSLSASIFELKQVNSKLGFQKLFRSGLEIGREHISSLVNTLVLAYAGSSLPIFISIVLNPSNYPIWVILNDGLLIEEVVRTLSGSLGLIFAVPLTALIASATFSQPEKNKHPAQ